MINSTALSQQIEEHLTRKLRAKDPEVQVRVKRTTLGWLKIRVITNLFECESLYDREKKN